jgi:tetratricopeptide (TPR) repeat protein
VQKPDILTTGFFNKALEVSPDNYLYLDTKGWGLYKQGKYQEALELLEKSWSLKPIFDEDVYLHLEEVAGRAGDVVIDMLPTIHLFNSIFII